MRIVTSLMALLISIAGSGQTGDFVTRWKTDNPGVSGPNQITIPFQTNIPLSYSVNWGDGTSSTGQTATSISHTYATPGTYTVRVSGKINSFRLAGGGDRLKLISIEQWGSTEWENFQYSFDGCENLVINAKDAPKFGYGMFCNAMFRNCKSLNQPINHWNTFNIVSMQDMFAGCTSFNQPLNNWNVIRVNIMARMFQGCTAFNQSLASWEPASLGYTPDMFKGCTSFNSPLWTKGGSGNSDMGGMFEDATAFNQPINFITYSCSNFSRMFKGAKSFNQPIAHFNIQRAQWMMNMLDGCGLSPDKYDAALIAWQAGTKINGVWFGAGGMKYCAGASARAALISGNQWNISGDAPLPPDVLLTSGSGTDDQTVCVNGNGFVPVTYSTSGATAASVTGLPAGLTGVFSNNAFTISGTPTQLGTYSYTVSFTGSCGVGTQKGKITVIQAGNWTNPGDNRIQTTCPNEAITPIVFVTTGINDVSYSGLPAGVSGTFSDNQVVLSGTPAASGTYNYSVTLNGDCPGTITGQIIAGEAKLTLLSASGTTSQSLCVNAQLTPIRYQTTGADAVDFSGLPPGVMGVWDDGVALISGKPTAPGTYTYTVNLTGACGQAEASGTIQVQAGGEMNLTSADADAQGVCSGSDIIPIVYATVGVNTVRYEGLPPGVTGNFSGGQVTISGKPTVAGSYNYKVFYTAGCGELWVGGSIQVDAAGATLTALDEVVTLCPESYLFLRYQISGTYKSFEINGFPAGVTAQVQGDKLVVSGNVSTEGVYHYSVVMTANQCQQPPLTGTLSVVEPVVSLASSDGAGDQLLCKDSAMMPALFQVTPTSLAKTPSLRLLNAPTGVSANLDGGMITVSGNPSQTGYFAYQLLYDEGNGCPAVNASAVLTVGQGSVVSAGPPLAYMCSGPQTTPALGGSFTGGDATGAVWGDNGAGGTFANNAGNTPHLATYTPPSGLSGLYTLTLYTVGGACVNSASKTLAVGNGETATWLGNSQNWDDALNWTGSMVPGPCTTVTIPNNVPVMPTITANDVQVFKLIIQTGARVNLAAGGKLEVIGK